MKAFAAEACERCIKENGETGEGLYKVCTNYISLD